MEDREIVALFNRRSEEAISNCKAKYGKYCRYVAGRILDNDEDSEEAENDTYMKAWNRIPPDDPPDLKAYLGMLCRQTAIDKRKRTKRAKRGGGEYALTLDELSELVSDGIMYDPTDTIAITDLLNRFLESLPAQARIVFMKRYFWVCPVKDIAKEQGISEGAVKMILSRSREKLRIQLEKEGFPL